SLDRTEMTVAHSATGSQRASTSRGRKAALMRVATRAARASRIRRGRLARFVALGALDGERVLEVLGAEAAGDAASVDEEGRRRLDACLRTGRDIGRDLGGGGGRRKAALELALTETEPRRVPDETRRIERALVLEQRGVVLL